MIGSAVFFLFVSWRLGGEKLWLQFVKKRGIMGPSEEKAMHTKLCICTVYCEERPPDR
jgi:hypothetical protein